MKRASCFLVPALVLASCGGSPQSLGVVAGENVTLDEYIAVFNKLTPDRQVAVLEPGGRMALMQNIVTKRVLQAASTATPASDAGFWETMYSSAWLADSMARRIAASFNPGPLLAELDSSQYTVSLLLMGDSVAASEAQLQWRFSGPSDPGGSISAPWSDSSGTGYRVLSGPAWHFPLAIQPVLESQGEGPVVCPLHGGWLVAFVEKTGENAGAEGSAAIGLFGWEIERITGVQFSAPAVTLFALEEDVPGNTVLASWNGGQLTAHLLSEILEKISPRYFPDGLPRELAVFSKNELHTDPVTSLWYVVLSVSNTMSLADVARAGGGRAPASIHEFAGTEALLRERVLVKAFPDSGTVAAFYEENPDFYTLPERRSVLLGYVEAESLPSVAGARSFSELGEFQTMADSAGNPVPTPLQPREAFGTLLGQRVFESDPGVFQGPVDVGRNLFAFYQVVADSPPERLPLDAVYGLIEAELLGRSFDARFTHFIDSLYIEFGVEIDTSAVQRVDPWTATLR